MWNRSFQEELMKWHSNDQPKEVAEHGNSSADFFSTAEERGIKLKFNWPVILALAIAIIIFILLLL